MEIFIVQKVAGSILTKKVEETMVITKEYFIVNNLLGDNEGKIEKVKIDFETQTCTITLSPLDNADGDTILTYEASGWY